MKKVNYKSPRFIRGLILLTWILGYIGILHPFHIRHLEQIQLFCYDPHFLSDYLCVPGGVSKFIADFLIQFFQMPYIGACIIFVLVCLFFLLRKNFFPELISNRHPLLILQVILLTLLCVHSEFPLSSTIASIITLFLLDVYNKANHAYLKKSLLILLPALIFILAGGFYALLSIVFLLIDRFLSGSNFSFGKSTFLICWVIASLSVYLTFRYIYITTIQQAISSNFPIFRLNIQHTIFFVLFLLCLVIPKNAFRYFSRIKFADKFKHSTLLLIVTLGILSISAYDNKTEKLFEIEYHFNQKEFDKVVRLVKKYPQKNRLVTYWGNISLSKQHQMGDHLFKFKQWFGQEGLTLKNEPVNIITLYNSALYDHLKYFNEARHWSYESLVVNGATPLQLKQLIKYELINGNYKTAQKYLKILSNTLFYRNWAIDHYKYTQSPLLINSDEEMSAMRRYLAYKDFFQDELIMRLKALLTLYPDNQAAFDYFMSYALLKKDLELFLFGMEYIGEFRFKNIPVHYEEALLVCKSIRKDESKDIEKYTIREDTKQRFLRYVQLFENARGKEQETFHILAKEFGSTFWFYLDFYPNTPETIDNKNVVLY